MKQQGTQTRAAEAYDFSGIWHSVYHYTSSVRLGLFTSEYDLSIYKIGNQVIMQSEPREDGSYVLLRLTLDGRIATGTWSEQTAPEGPYKGVTCYGALQLVLSENGDEWHGMWVAYGRNLEVRSGNWDIIRTQPAK